MTSPARCRVCDTDASDGTIEVMDNEDDTPGLRTACPTCGGNGHIHEPKLAVLGGQRQTVLAPRSCPQCGDLAEPGWLPGFVQPA